MVSANVKIIEALQFFLDTVIKDADIRALFTTSPSDFTRARKLPLQNLIGMCLLIFPCVASVLNCNPFLKAWTRKFLLHQECLQFATDQIKTHLLQSMESLVNKQFLCLLW
jgi:hypothetical protein